MLIWFSFLTFYTHVSPRPALWFEMEHGESKINGSSASSPLRQLPCHGSPELPLRRQTHVHQTIKLLAKLKEQKFLTLVSESIESLYVSYRTRQGHADKERYFKFFRLTTVNILIMQLTTFVCKVKKCQNV